MNRIHVIMKKQWKKTVCALVLVVAFVLSDLGGAAIAGANQAAAGGGSRPGPLEVQAAGSEYRAFWFSYYDYEKYRKQNGGASASSFRKYFTKVCKNGKNLGMNRVIVQVRPFADAMYRSKYFPWSKFISGKQGKSPGFDPLEIMVSTAHKNGLKIEAWVNPYRVAYSTSFGKLSRNNPARKWHSQKGKKRNVLVYNGAIYFNPAKKEVRDLIVNGVREIVQNYDVDGIHMDDYFYPTFSKRNVKKSFDAPEYKKSKLKKQGKSIATYRRTMVNYLVKRIYAAVKATRPDCTFGISPAGNLKNLTSPLKYYCDVDTWMKHQGYMDYICPQVYWGFRHPYAGFSKVMNQWASKARYGYVKLYVGIAVYKAGHHVGENSAEKKEWRSDSGVLAKMVSYGRSHGAKGFAFFDYSDLVSSKSKNAVKKLRKVLR